MAHIFLFFRRTYLHIIFYISTTIAPNEKKKNQGTNCVLFNSVAGYRVFLLLIWKLIKLSTYTYYFLLGPRLNQRLRGKSATTKPT